MTDTDETPKAEWWFYHLEGGSLVNALAPLLEKCLESGWRVLVSSPSPTTLENLNTELWTYRDGSFLPHGLEDGETAPSRQPVLLSTELSQINDSNALVLLDGRDAPPEAPYSRVMVVFDGKDTETRDVARQQFRVARQKGLGVRYFQQKPGGGWAENKS